MRENWLGTCAAPVENTLERKSIFDETEIDFLDFLDLCFEGKTTFEKVARRASTLPEKNAQDRHPFSHLKPE